MRLWETLFVAAAPLLSMYEGGRHSIRGGGSAARGGRDVRGEITPPAHVNDVRFRFHNVHGLRDKRFREYYLHKARASCEVLALAETNCYSEEEGAQWSREWMGTAGCFWAPSPPPVDEHSGGTCRGMAILFARSLGEIHAKVVWKDVGGRGLAVQACIHGRPTIIIATHADCDSDSAQVESYQRACEGVPFKPGHDYVWMLDANNIVDVGLDGRNSTGQPAKNSCPRGVVAMHACTTKWGWLQDAYRSKAPHGTEYTHKQVVKVDRTGRGKDEFSFGRIDRIYVSPHMLNGQHPPQVKRVAHLRHTHTDILALKRSGSTSKWSDHSAVQLTMQYTDTARPPPRWSVPRHLLKQADFVNNELRRLAASGGTPGATAQHQLTNMLRRTKQYLTRRVGEEQRVHGMQLRRLEGWLAEVERGVGDGMGSRGYLHTLPDDEPTKPIRIAFYEMRREAIENKILNLIRRKQERWCEDRDFDRYMYDETCSKAFFEEVRTAKTYSYIEHVRKPNGQTIKGVKKILKTARAHFGETGAIFNLNPKGNITDAQRVSRARLLAALKADGMFIPESMRGDLEIANVFTPEVVQCAIDELPTGTVPGIDGWTAEYFKVVGARVEDEDGILQPSPLAQTIASVFKSCADSGEMLSQMRTSIVSLIYKEKGRRDDLSKYRPIAVNSILYRVLAKAMVIAMRPILPHVTSDCQKAFKPAELIADATRTVQDTIHYCQATGTQGFLLFCDQDNAYPRVRWDYLFEVMRSMGFPESFVSMVRTMYNACELKLKVNGTIDGESISPTNGLAQGCPLSPCLYLLCIQGLVSLMNTDSRTADGIKGIPIPGGDGFISEPLLLICSAFADDICVFLRDPSQLERFRELLTTYCEGAGAVNSWDKTVGLQVGTSGAEVILPQGWEEGRDITCHPTVTIDGKLITGILRYLGVFLGVQEGVARGWIARTTKRIEARANRWRERRMPSTRAGRAVALRNSILALAWYLVENQTPPDLEAMMDSWRTTGWEFMAESTVPYCRRNVPRGGLKSATNVRHETLIQDYAEGGQRVQDVELFAKALQVRKIRHVVEPRPQPHANFALFWLRGSYGHLRQGKRLLLSTCDFLHFSANKEGRTPPLSWVYTLQAAGSMRGWQPVVSQAGASPHVMYPLGAREAGVGGKMRTVNCKGVWGLGEVLSEPLFYNANVNGWWGAKVVDPAQWDVADRERDPHVRLQRWSGNRVKWAEDMYRTTQRFAQLGMTHVIHLLKGTQAGGRLAWKTYADILHMHLHGSQGLVTRSRVQSRDMAVSEEEFNSLIDALPVVWKEVVAAAAARKRENPRSDVFDLIRREELPPGTWVRDSAGRVGQVMDRRPEALHAFSGRAGRKDGLAAYLLKREIRCTEVDTVIHSKRHDLLDDATFKRLRSYAQQGRFQVGFFGVPCSTFSVARLHPEGTEPRAVRDRENKYGLPDITPEERREADRANELVRRSVSLAYEIVNRGGACPV